MANLEKASKIFNSENVLWSYILIFHGRWIIRFSFCTDKRMELYMSKVLFTFKFCFKKKLSKAILLSGSKRFFDGANSSDKKIKLIQSGFHEIFYDNTYKEVGQESTVFLTL